VVRHVYTFQLDVEKIRPLVEEAPIVMAQVHLELLAFASFLEKRVQIDS